MAAKKDAEEFDQLLVSSKVLEALFGVKDRTIRDLADKGIIKRDSHGKYLFWNSAKSYITALKIAASTSVVLTVALSAGYMIWTETALNAKIAVELIALMYLSFLVATNGYDKVVQAIKQIKDAAENK